MKKSPSARKQMPMWSIPMEAPSCASGSVFSEARMWWGSMLSMLSVREDSRRSRMARFLARSSRCRLMALAEWRPASPCICKPSVGSVSSRGHSLMHCTTLHCTLHRVSTALYTVIFVIICFCMDQLFAKKDVIQVYAVIRQ